MSVDPLARVSMEPLTRAIGNSSTPINTKKGL